MDQRRWTQLMVALCLGVALTLTGCAENTDGGEAESASAEPTPLPTAQDFADDQVLAVLGEEEVTWADIKDDVSGKLKELRQERYDALKQAIDMKLNSKLIEAEAASRGIEERELFMTEIQAKIQEPTEQQLSIFFDQNIAQMGGRSFEEMKPQITQYLTGQQAQKLQAQFLASLRRGQGARLMISPPREDFELPDTIITKGGDETAPVTIVEFADFECTFCRRAHPTVERLLAEYGDKIRYAFYDHPLEMHPRAVPASAAARCADEQDKYWDYHESLMVMRGDLSDADLNKRASDLGLDLEQFSACFESGRYTDLVNVYFQHGRDLGVTATPTFLINGRMVVGMKEYEEMKDLIEEEIAMAG